MTSATILLVDDEPGYLEAMRTNLEADGYHVLTAADGPEALALADSAHPEIVLLDLRMPHMDGFEVLRQLRQRSEVPVIVVSALAAEGEKLRGFRLGADDYVTKPFSVAELEERVMAVLRRSKARKDAASAPADYADDVLRTDIAHRRVFLKGEDIRLTATETLLLRQLLLNIGEVVPSVELWRTVLGQVSSSRENTIQVLIYRLRRRVEPDPANPVYIRNRRGLGYVFVPLKSGKAR